MEMGSCGDLLMGTHLLLMPLCIELCVGACRAVGHLTVTICVVLGLEGERRASYRAGWLAGERGTILAGQLSLVVIHPTSLCFGLELRFSRVLIVCKSLFALLRRLQARLI